MCSSGLFVSQPGPLTMSGWGLSDERGSFIDRKSTRLNSSHMSISYAVFCLKKKNNELSSKMAGFLAFRVVAPKCKPVLLGPLGELDMRTPYCFLGDVMGDISARGGQHLGS